MFAALHVISWIVMAILLVYGFYDVTLLMAKAAYDKKCRVFGRQITYGLLFMALVSSIEDVINYLTSLKLAIPDTSGLGQILNTLAGYNIIFAVLFLIVFRFALYGIVICVVWAVCKILVKKNANKKPVDKNEANEVKTEVES